MTGIVAGRHSVANLISGLLEGESNMRNNNISMQWKNFKPTLLILSLVLMAVQTLSANGIASPQTAPGRNAELATATEAKRILANLGREDFSKAKDPKLRLEARKAVGVLKAIAANTSTTREGTLIAQLHRSVLNLKNLPQPAGISLEGCNKTYDACIELCKEGAGNCKLCDLGVEGCYILQLAAAIGKTY
jgi:hypothetical protein